MTPNERLIRDLETQRQRDDEMSIQTDRLLQDAAETIRDLETKLDNENTRIVDLCVQLGSARKAMEGMLREADRNTLPFIAARAWLLSLSDENSK